MEQKEETEQPQIVAIKCELYGPAVTSQEVQQQVEVQLVGEEAEINNTEEVESDSIQPVQNSNILDVFDIPIQPTLYQPIPYQQNFYQQAAYPQYSYQQNSYDQISPQVDLNIEQAYMQQPYAQVQSQNYQTPNMYNISNSDSCGDMVQNIGLEMNNCNISMPGHSGKIQLLRPKVADKKVVAVIVSFCNGSTYDSLFTSVEQKTLEGTQVLVYSCPSGYLPTLLQAFQTVPTDQSLIELLANIKEVDPDCVVFNWECSSNYGGSTFTEGKATLFKFLRMMLDAKHMCMFSDFSLKALINEWDAEVMGKNPFQKTGETSSEAALRFKAGVLKECPSAQLQLVGDLAEGGMCNIHCLGGTILYSVNKANIDEEQYTLQILTINSTNIPAAELLLELDEHKGSAGHILLRYKSGGCLLTSMGHWVELMKIDTSEKKLFEVAEREYGAVYAQQMRSEYDNLQGEAQQSYIRKNAVNFVQNSAPCWNMNKKAQY